MPKVTVSSFAYDTPRWKDRKIISLKEIVDLVADEHNLDDWLLDCYNKRVRLEIRIEDILPPMKE